MLRIRRSGFTFSVKLALQLKYVGSPNARKKAIRCAMRRKKHKVIRVYRADEGKENSPIDVDGDGDNRDVESEEEMCESENTELDDRPQKRPKVD